MQKKSQATLFIIVGLVVLFMFALVIYSKSSKVKSVATSGIEKLSVSQFAKDPIVAYVKSCIDIVSIQAAYDIGLYGGYAKPPQGYFQTQAEGYDYNVTLVLKDGQNKLLSIPEIERQMAEYMKINLPKCVKNFNDFKDYTVEQGEISSHVKINDDSYDMKVTYPLSIRIGSSQIKVTDFDPVTVPIRLKHIHQIVQEITGKSVAHPENLEIMYLLGLEKDGIKVAYFPKPDDRKLVFILNDEKASVLKGSIILGPNDKNPQSNRQYLFVFGMDFSWYQRPAENQFSIIRKLVDGRNQK